MILRAALRIVDRDGVDGLSMRRLSDEVGRDPTVLYRHIPNKAALLDGVAEIVLGQLHVDAADPDWAAQLRAVAQDFRRLALEHPNVVPLLVTRPLATPLGQRPPGMLRPLAAPGSGRRTCLPLAPARSVTSASIIACMTCRPAPMASASSPSCMFPAISAIATLTCSGIASAVASAGWFWLLFFMAVPLLLVCLGRRPTPTTRQVSSGGPPPQLLRDPGQPRQAQRFLFAFGSIRQHFRPRRHLISAPEWRTEMTNRFAVWNQIITAAAA